MNAKNKEVQVIEPEKDLAPTSQELSQQSPAMMMIRAKEAGLDAEQMKEMLAVQKDWEANEARKAYHLAVAAFKAEEISITKDKKVGYDSNDGQSRTEYSHASLANIVETSVPYLSRHGLSHGWTTEQQEGGIIRVTCHLTHELGHSESTSLQSSPDSSGKKNNIQAIASTITYLERYTFLAITGLATRDMQDDDAETAEPEELITEKQAADIRALIEEVGIKESEFLRVAKHDLIEAIPAHRYAAAVGMLERRRDAS